MIVEISNPTLCRNIRYLRKRYALSRRAFCRLTEISPYLLEAIEKEEDRLKFHSRSLSRLCQVFDVKLEDLCSKEPSLHR